MNLATARAGQRAREVGLRKVLGASRWQLLGQFLGESFVLAFLSIWLGLAFAELLLPNFNYLTEKNFTQLPWFEVEFWGVVIFIILLISLLTGLYPAVYLSSFPPTWILQNKAQRGWHLGRMWLNPANVRKGLVILQFALSIGLMVCTLVAYSQWDYMRNQPLGFDRANIAVIDIPIGDTVLLHNLPAIRAKLHQNPQVIGTTVCTTVMDGRMPKYEHLIKVGERWGVEPINVLIVDEHYIPLLNIKLKEGKNFLPAHPDSIQTSVIINETLARKMGWKNPIGKLIGNGFLTKAKYAQGDTVLCEVIGVVEDFHYQSLQHKIEPLAMYCMPKNPGYLMAKMKPEEAEKTQDWLRNIWQRLDSKHPVDAFSLEKHIISRYEPQGKLVAIFGYFSLLAIAISGLGLLGLTSYLTEQRTKEIGIRRVLGASAGEVVRFFALEFVWLVVVSFLLASPVVYVLMLRWLKDFAYHATPSLAHFLIAGLSSLTLALVTVSWLTWKVAKRKPSIALRYGG
jgi:putative ABC transport system permease protein